MSDPILSFTTTDDGKLSAAPSTRLAQDGRYAEALSGFSLGSPLAPSRLKATVSEAALISPDAYARAGELAKLRSTTPDEIMLDQKKAELTVFRTEAQELLSKHPTLRRYAENPDNVKLSIDDLKQLRTVAQLFRAADLSSPRIQDRSFFERNILDVGEMVGRTLGRGFGDDRPAVVAMQTLRVFDRVDEFLETNGEPTAAEWRQFMLDLPGVTKAHAFSYQKASPEKRARMRADLNAKFHRNVEESAASDFVIQEMLPQDREFNAVVAEGDVGNILKSLLDDPMRAVRLMVSGYGFSAPQLIAAAGAGSIGGPEGTLIAGLVGAMGSFLTEEALGINESLGRLGIDTTDPEALREALSNPEILDQVTGEAKRKGLGVAMIDALAIVAGRGFIPRRIGSVALSRAARTQLNVLSQVPLQGALEALGEATGQQLAFGEIDIGQVVLEGIAGMGAGEAIIGSIQNLRDEVRVRRAVDNEVNRQHERLATLNEKLQEIATAVAETKTGKRSKEALQSLIDTAREDTQLDTVLLSPEGVREVFQTGQEERVFYEALGIEQGAVENALSTGEYLEINVSALVGMENAMEVLPLLQQDMKTSREELTAREMEYVEALDHGALAQFLQNVQTPQQEARQADLTAEPIRKEIFSQLRATGQSVAQARANALLVKSAYETLARRTGRTAGEVFAENPLTIRREDRSAPAAVSATETAERARISSELARITMRLEEIGPEIAADEKANDEEAVTSLEVEANALEMDRRAMLEAAQNRITLEQAAFHGTPHRFDRFSTDAIGTGEGAQAYGWGLYFAEREDIARFYRDQLTIEAVQEFSLGSIKFYRRGEPVDYSPRTHDSDAIAKASFQEAVLIDERSLVDALKEGGETAVQEHLDGVLQEFIDDPGYEQSTIDYYKRIQDRMRSGVMKVEMQIDEPGAIFKVDIAADEDAWLDWEAEFRDQSPRVRDAIKRAFSSDEGEGYWRGRLEEDFAENGPMGYDADRFERVLDAAFTSGSYSDEFGTSVWDEMSEAAPEVADEARDWIEKHAGDLSDDATGEQIYHMLESMLGSDKAASMRLLEEGVAGNKYRDAASRDDGEAETFNWVVFDDNIVTIMDEVFQTNGSGPRGSAQFFPTGEVVVNLFDKADRSTFLHESGHVFFTIMERLAQQPGGEALISDLDAIRRWTGQDDLSSVEAQERFAEGFEKYLLEGKAPNKELRTAFQSFKRWLTAVYRNIASNIGLYNVELTDEVRGVMDRMLASEETIDEATQDGSVTDSYDVLAAQLGATEKEVEALRQKRAEAIAKAREKTLARLMADLKKERTAEYKAALEDNLAAVEAEMSEERVWKALAYLRQNAYISAADRAKFDADEIGAPVQIDRAQFIELFGQDVLDSLPGGAQRGGITRKKGQSPELAAELLGYASADELIKDISALQREDGTYPSFSEVMREEAKKRTDEALGTALSEERIREDAQAGLHNADHGSLINTEMNMLRRLAAKTITDRVAERAVSKEGSQTATEAADAAKTGDPLMDQFVLESIERQARRASRAERSGGARTREATTIPIAALREAARRRVQRMQLKEFTTKELNRLNRDEIRASKKADAAIARREYTKATLHKWQQLWTHYTIAEIHASKARAKTALTRMKKTAKRKPNSANMNVEYLAQTKRLIAQFQGTAPVPSEMQAVRAWVDNQNVAGPNGLPMQIVIDDAVWQMTENFEDMTFAQLLMLDKGVRSMISNGIQLAAEERAEFRDMLNTLNTSIYANNRVKERPEYQTIKSMWDEKVVEWFIGGHRKVEHALQALDGMAELGPTWRAVFQPVQEAAGRETRMMKDAADRFAKIWETLEADRSFWTRKHHFDGVGTLTKREILMVGMNWGNEQNRDAVMNAGRNWSEADALEIIGTISDKEWNFIQQTWDFINSYWDQIATLEKEMTGVAPKKVEADPFVTPNGKQMPGGYFPIMFDPKRSAKADRKQLTDSLANDLLAGAAARAQTQHGHTFERGKNAQPVWLSLDVIARHMDTVIHDITHRKAVRDVQRILRSKPFQDAIIDVHGQSMNRFLDGWLKEIAAGRVTPETVSDKLYKHARIGLSVAEMGFSLRTALVQPFGLTQSIARLGAGPVMGAVQNFYRDPATAVERINRLSDEMSARGTNFDREVSDATRWRLPSQLPGTLGLSADAAKAVRNTAFWIVGKLDMSVAYPTWMAAYDVKIEQGATQEDAILYADQIVRTTQGSGMAKDLAAVQRGGEGARLMTAFYSFFAAFHNITVDAMLRTKKKAKEDGLLSATMYGAAQFFWLVALPSLMSKWILDGGPEEEDEWESWALGTLVQYSGSGLIGIRDGVNALTSDFGYSGPPAARALSETINALTQWGQVMGGEDVDKATVRSTLMSIGYLTHLPTRQTWRTIDAWAEADNAWEGVVGTLGMKHYQENR